MAGKKESRLQVAFVLLNSLSKREFDLLEFYLSRHKGGNHYKSFLESLKKAENFDERQIKRQLAKAGITEQRIRDAAKYVVRLLLSIRENDPLNRSKSIPTLFLWAERLIHADLLETAFEMLDLIRQKAIQQEKWGFGLEAVARQEYILSRERTGFGTVFESVRKSKDRLLVLTQNHLRIVETYHKLKFLEKQRREKTPNQIKTELTEIRKLITKWRGGTEIGAKSQILIYLSELMLDSMAGKWDNCLQNGEVILSYLKSLDHSVLAVEEEIMRILSILLPISIQKRDAELSIQLKEKLQQLTFLSIPLKAEKFNHLEVADLLVVSIFPNRDRIIKKIQKLRTQNHIISKLPEKLKFNLVLLVLDLLIRIGRYKMARSWVRDMRDCQPHKFSPKAYFLSKLFEAIVKLGNSQFESAIKLCQNTSERLPESEFNRERKQILALIRELAESQNAGTIMEKYHFDLPFYQEARPFNLQGFLLATESGKDMIDSEKREKTVGNRYEDYLDL